MAALFAHLFRWPDGEVRALDGTPLSEWDQYQFTPQPDITAYELALILQDTAGIVPGLTSQQPWTLGVNVRAGGQYVAEWEQIKRHFTKRGKSVL